MLDSSQKEAEAILDYLASIPFENCIVLSKEFRELSMNAGIYAVRHCTLGILYIGKTRTLRDRFRGGHKALLWAFIEELKPTDVRIATFALEFDSVDAVIIRARKPNYSSLRPTLQR